MFQMRTEIQAKTEVKYGSWEIIRKGRQAELSFLHAIHRLTRSIIIPSATNILLTVAELCSGNEMLTHPNRPPADVHHFNNHNFPVEKTVKIWKSNTGEWQLSFATIFAYSLGNRDLLFKYPLPETTLD